MEKANQEKKVTEIDVYNQAWNYFQFHVQQRMSFINFFIVFSIALNAAQVAIFTVEKNIYYFGIVIGIMQILLSIVFFIFDNRSRFLIISVENVLREIEKNFNFSPEEYLNKIRIFTIKEKKTAECKIITHGPPIKLLFGIFGGAGFVGILISIILMII